MMEREALRELLYAHDADDLDIPFWEGCERGELLVHRCGICQRSYWPACLCVVHGGTAMRWVPASGRGTVHTYTIMRHSFVPAMREKVPYNVAVIKLDEGPFLHSNVIDCPVEEMRSGMPVQVVFAAHASGLTLPLFKRA